MLKLKNILPVFVVLLFLGVASTAFAQVTCGVASTPVSRDTTTGLTEPAGDVTFTCTQTGSANAAATITVDYQGMPITNSASYPTTTPVSKPIGIAGAPTVPTGCNAIPTISNVVNATGQVIISVPASIVTATTAPCSFTLTGVLLEFGASEKTSGSTLQANVSVSPANNLLITAGQNTPTIVTAILDAIATSGVKVTTPPGPAVVLTSGFNPSGTFTTTVTENYIDAFRSQAQFNGGAATNGTQFLFTFSGIPTNSNITCSAPTANHSNNAVIVGSPVASGSTNTVLVEWTGGFTGTGVPPQVVGDTTGLSTIDTLSMVCTFSVGTATLPLAAANITETVALSPLGSAFCSPGNSVCTTTTAGQIPRFTGPTWPLTVVSIVSPQTNVLFPFVTVGGGFDTGLAIANTGNDPFGSEGQSGPVSVVFYPQGTGTPFCVATGAGAPGTTDGVPVSGITAGCTVLTTVPGSGITSGNLGNGSTWAVNSSDLVKAGGAGSSFSGYAFALANAPLVHGTFFVYLTSGGNFAGFSGGPALIVPNVTLGSPRTLTTFEGLNH